MKILIPVTETPASREAVRFGSTLAQQPGDVLILLTVGEAPDSAAHADELRTRFGAMLTQLAREPESSGIAVETRIDLSGEAEESIVHAATADAVDLVVMATKVRPMLSRLTRGSLSDAVLRRARRPVTLVPLPAEFWEDPEAG